MKKVALVFFGILILGFFAVKKHYDGVYESLQPPSNVTTYEDFSLWNTHPKKIGYINHEEKLLVVSVGSHRFLASGPTVYFFLEEHLVDWVYDYNDSESEYMLRDYSPYKIHWDTSLLN